MVLFYRRNFFRHGGELSKGKANFTQDKQRNPSGDKNYIDLQENICGKGVYQIPVKQSVQPEATALKKFRTIKPHGNVKEYIKPYLEPIRREQNGPYGPYLAPITPDELPRSDEYIEIIT